MPTDNQHFYTHLFFDNKYVFLHEYQWFIGKQSKKKTMGYPPTRVYKSLNIITVKNTLTSQN